MNKHYIYFISAGHMSTDLATGALPAILPFLVSERGMSYTEVAGLIFASAMLASALQPLFGYFADRVTRHWFMGLGIMLSGTAIAVTGFLEDYWLMFAFVALVGIGNSMFHPEAARLVNLIAGRSARGQGMAAFSVGGNAGFAFGPISAVALVSFFGLQGLAVFAVIGIGMGAATLVLSPRIVQKAAHLQRQESSGAGRSPDKTEARTGAVHVNDWHAFSRLTLVLLGRSAVFNGIMTFLPLYCIHTLSVSNAVGGTVLSVFAVCGILMTIVGGWLADHIGLVNTARCTTAALIPSLLLIACAPNIWIIYLLLLPLCFATHGLYSSMVVLGQTYLSKSIGFASGVTLGLSTSFGGIIAPLMGKLADHAGISSVIYLLIGIGAVCTIGAFLLPKPRGAA